MRSKRVYTFLHFKGEDGGTRVILGKEQALHPGALDEMRDILGNFPSQCESMKKCLENGQDLIDENGRPLCMGQWSGGNFGGILLIARSALPGGRVEKTETVEEAAIREMVEEYGINPCVKSRYFRFAQVCCIRRPRSNIEEVYLSLDLDEHFSKELDENDLMAPKSILAGGPTDEKRSIFSVPLSDLVKEFDDEITEGDLVFLDGEIEKLSNEFCALVGAQGYEEAVKKKLLDFQIKRHMHTAQEASILLVSSLALSD